MPGVVAGFLDCDCVCDDAGVGFVCAESRSALLDSAATEVARIKSANRFEKSDNLRKTSSATANFFSRQFQLSHVRRWTPRNFGRAFREWVSSRSRQARRQRESPTALRLAVVPRYLILRQSSSLGEQQRRPDLRMQWCWRSFGSNTIDLVCDNARRTLGRGLVPPQCEIWITVRSKSCPKSWLCFARTC